MNILVVTEAGTWVEPHIIGSLRDAGHTVETYFYGPGVGEFYGRARAGERQRKNKELLALARRLRAEGGLDLVFCYVYDDFLLEETARALQALDVPVVNYNVDMARQWYRQIRTARYFTRMLCAQRAHMQEFSRFGGRPYYFPMAARIPSRGMAPDEPFATAASVTFLGTPTPYRVSVLSRISEAGIPLAVYGRLWTEARMAAADMGLEKTLSDLFHYGRARLRAEGPAALLEALASRFPSLRAVRAIPAVPVPLLKGALPDGALEKLFAASPINLGMTRMSGDDPDFEGLTQVKLRDFEVPAAGGFYLVEAAPDYSDLFRIGSEIETWSTFGELIEKIRYFLDHDDERRRIAAAGQERALRDHTWERRFAGLFRELDLA